MTHFIENGNTYMVSAESALTVLDHLPTGTYTVKYNEMKDFYFLETVENFRLGSSKIYGDPTKTAERIMNTFMDRPNSTGVMLSGEKGSGKTLLAKMLSIKGLEMGIPTIIVNQPWFGDTFNTFMQQIDQPTIVIFDEFEKVYDSKEQEQMLTLLDGVYSSKKLFILTCNDKYRIDSHMKNRPGRIYYRIDYSGIEEAFIREYCEDNLQVAEHVDVMCKIGNIFPQFNFDMMKAMVEEMNRYGESPQEVLRLLNAKPEHSDANTYKIDLTVHGAPASIRYGDKTWQGNPIGGKIVIHYSVLNAESVMAEWEKELLAQTDLDEDGDGTAVFTLDDLLPSNTENGVYHYKNAKGEALTLTRQAASTFNWEMVL